MRVLLLIHNLDLGGAQIAVFNLAKGLSAAGCHPLVFAWRRGGLLVPRFREAGIAVAYPEVECSAWRRLFVPRRLRQALEDHGADLINAHMSDSAVWASLALRGSRWPCVLSHHTNELIDTVGRGRPLYGWARKGLLFASVRRAAANIAVSRSVRDRLARAARVPAASIDVVPNGVQLLPAARCEQRVTARWARFATLQENKRGPRIVFVGRLDKVKAVATLIEALPKLRAVMPAARLELVGEGPEEQALRTLARNLGVEPQVIFHGFTQDVTALLEEADFLVSASTLEGLPLAVLEAMAAGLPVVVSDIPGHQELIAGRETGLLFLPRDTEALVERLVEACNDPMATRDRAGRALTMVQENYGSDTMARRHLAIFERVLR